VERAPLPSAEELIALSRKYETIAKLRRDRQGGGGVAARSVLRALAREFPGALRELDTVALAEVDRRRLALLAAADGGRAEAWMTWMVAYHATMRAALVVKGRIARATALSDELVEIVARDASRQTNVTLDDAFVRTVARPPAGRLNAAVFDLLGQRFGVSPERIWEELFPARRVGRY